jgi:hypothetical protein
VRTPACQQALCKHGLGMSTPSDDVTRPASRSAAARLAGLNEFQRREFPARLAAHDEVSPGYARKWYRLEDLLVTHGGHAAVVGFSPDPELDDLLARGARFVPDRVEHHPGRPSHCHANVATEWFASEATSEIATGYALSPDGLWRQHSWLVQPASVGGALVLVETTTARVAYFGVTLSFSHAAAFAAGNIDPADLAVLPAPSIPFSERLVEVLGLTGQVDDPAT